MMDLSRLKGGKAVAGRLGGEQRWRSVLTRARPTCSSLTVFSGRIAKILGLRPQNVCVCDVAKVVITRMKVGELSEVR